MAWTPLQNIRGNAQDALELFHDNPKVVLITLGILIIVSLSAWDIFEGQWVTEDGTVVNQYQYTTYSSVCTSYDRKGNCATTTSVPVENYRIVVRHQAGTDDVDVSLFTYLEYSPKDSCIISYREGGVLGIHWFQTIKHSA